MGAYASKTPENQQKLASQNIFQKKNAPQPQSKYAGKRPEGSIHAQMAALAQGTETNATNPVQKKASQGGEVIQRVGLSKDKLNVVGEEHHISGLQYLDLDRRRDEKKFCEEKTGSSNYWKENEFRNKDGSTADPENLQFIQGFSFLLDLINKLSLDIEAVESKFGIIPFKLENLINPGINVTNLLLSDKYKHFFEKEEDYKIIQETSSTFQRLSNLYNGLDENKKPRFTQEFFKRPGFVKKLQSVLAPFDEKKDFTKRYMLNYKSSKQVAIERSIDMYNAANEKHDTIGVWKVGQAHVRDMETPYYDRMKSKTIEFNLLKKDDFDKEFFKDYPQYKNLPKEALAILEQQRKDRLF